MGSWGCGKALAGLNVEETAFDATDGNVMGFARGRSIAISPLNPLPHKTLFHELGHVVLGHTTEGAQALADSFEIRRTALTQKIPYYTTLAGAKAAARAIEETLSGSLEVAPLQSYS